MNSNWSNAFDFDMLWKWNALYTKTWSIWWTNTETWLLVLILELKSTVISCSPKLSHFHRNEEYSMSVGKKLDERHQLSFNCVTSHFLSDEASFLEVSLCLPTLFHFWTVLLLEWNIIITSQRKWNNSLTWIQTGFIIKII